MDAKAQKRAIVDKLTGAPANSLPPDTAFDEPWRTIYRRLAPARDLLEATLLLIEAAADLEDGHTPALELFDLLPGDDAFAPFSSLPQPPAAVPTSQEASPNSRPRRVSPDSTLRGLSATYPSLHDLSAQFPPVDWLWPSWIPRGMVTLFGAAPGVGKSLVALDLARRIIHGDTFPDGASVPDPGRNVIIVDAEGAPALLYQRARAWEVDLRRLFLMIPPTHNRLVDLSQELQRLHLIQMVRDLKPVLIVVDSLAAATARGETSIHGARDLLGFLGTVARRARLALLIIHHLRKSARSGGSTPAQASADDLRGSSHLSAAARSVLTLTLLNPKTPRYNQPPVGKVLQPTEGSPISTTPASPEDNRPSRRLEVVKTNLCRLPPPLALTFEGEDAEVPTLRYSEYLEPPPPPTQLDLCARWLLDYLAAAGAPVKPADAIRAAAQQGFPRQTLYRTRRSLAGIVIDRGNSPHDPHKRWTLASDPSPPPEGTPPESGTVVQ